LKPLVVHFKASAYFITLVDGQEMKRESANFKPKGKFTMIRPG